MENYFGLITNELVHMWSIYPMCTCAVMLSKFLSRAFFEWLFIDNVFYRKIKSDLPVFADKTKTISPELKKEPLTICPKSSHVPHTQSEQIVKFDASHLENVNKFFVLPASIYQQNKKTLHNTIGISIVLHMYTVKINWIHS